MKGGAVIHYHIKNSDIVHEEFGGDMVILNLASGQYFGLNPSGSQVWTALLSGADASKLTDDPNLQSQVTEFVSKLETFELMVKAKSAPAEAPAPIAFSDAPTLDVYSDLADLITADPIHDVDVQVGWPKVPETD